MRKAAQTLATNGKHRRPIIDEAASILRSLTESGGFLGAAIMTPSGDLLAEAPHSQRNMTLMAALGSNLLLHATDAMAETKTGAPRTVHLEGTAGDILLACSDGLAEDGTEERTGSPHFHLVILMRPDGNVGKAKILARRALKPLAGTLGVTHP